MDHHLRSVLLLLYSLFPCCSLLFPHTPEPRVEEVE